MRNNTLALALVRAELCRAYAADAGAPRSPATTTIATLVERHDSLCEDMEAAAIGLVCTAAGVPFVSIKDISNNELRRATEATARGWPSLDDLAPELGRRAALVVEAIVRAWRPAVARP